MTSLPFIVGAIGGAIAGAIAWLLVRKQENRNTANAIIGGAAGGVFVFLKLLTPDLIPASYLQTLEQRLAQEPVFHAVQKHEPAFFKSLVKELEARMDAGINQQQMAQLAYARLMPMFRERLAVTSDDAVIFFAKAVVGGLEELSARPDACVAWVKGGAVGAGRGANLSISVQSALNIAMGKVLEDAKQTPQAAAKPGEVEGYLTPVYQKLLAEYGDDVNLLNQLDSPTVDKAKACTIMRAQFNNILELPKEHSGKILRRMFAGR